MYCTFSKILDDFFALSYALFAVRLQIYTCSRPFRSSMSYVASRALSIPKTTYRETTSFILSHFSQFKYRCYYPIRQKFSWETNSCSANRKIPHIYTKLPFFTVFTVLEFHSYTQPAEFSLHFQTWLRQPIPKSKIDWTIHFSGFPVSLIHHHHVQEGLGLIPVPCILKMKLVPPSLPRSSYVPSSFWLIL